MSADPEKPAAKSSIVLASLGVVGLTAVLAVIYWLRPAPLQSVADNPDPRKTYKGPFQNVHPDVGYVPDETCANCHQGIAEAYSKHSMGRAIYPIAKAPITPDDGASNIPFEAFGSSFTVEREGADIRHVRTKKARDGSVAARAEWRVDYAIGSGTRGHSYLANQGGSLVLTPMSWYSQQKKWDLTPGISLATLTGRAVFPDCLYCHAHSVNPIKGTVNHYADPPLIGPAIGCQRCHGPGALHVAERTRLDEKDRGGADHSIVNPSRLTPTLADAVCEQCHLQGQARTVRYGREFNDYRPGLPAELFWTVFVVAPSQGGTDQAVGHVEQMHQSRCYQNSEGETKLGCVSCHDPHRHVSSENRQAFYRDRCLRCHQTKGCAEPLAKRTSFSKDDSCIDCHMPRYAASDIPHTAGTNHRVPRKAERTVSPVKDGEKPALTTWEPFYKGRPTVDESVNDRGKFIALTKLALAGDLEAVKLVSAHARSFDALLTKHPDDIPALEARAYGLGFQNRVNEAITAFEHVLAIRPRWETSLSGMASVAEEAGKLEFAIEHWRKATEVNPRSSEFRRRLTNLLLKADAYEGALSEANSWITIDPFSIDARSARVQALLALGRHRDARSEFATVEKLEPANLRELRIRFERRLKQ